VNPIPFPPAHPGRPLNPSEIALLAEWVTCARAYLGLVDLLLLDATGEVRDLGPPVKPTPIRRPLHPRNPRKEPS